MKLVIISMDLMIAIPLGLATLYLMITGSNSILGYQYASSASYASTLHSISISQELAAAIDFGNLNYPDSMALIHSESQEYGLSIYLEGVGHNESCSTTCRIVDIRNESYVLVIGNESPN